MRLCKSCGEREVHNKKRGLCMRCYQYERSTGKQRGKLEPPENGNRGNIDGIKIPTTREANFIENYFTHDDWTYEPAIFYLHGPRYIPDFYDKKENVFIEVCGSRQAYHQNKGKYLLFNEYFPGLKLEIRTEDGGLLSEKNNGEMWKSQYAK